MDKQNLITYIKAHEEDIYTTYEQSVKERLHQLLISKQSGSLIFTASELAPGFYDFKSYFIRDTNEILPMRDNEVCLCRLDLSTHDKSVGLIFSRWLMQQSDYSGSYNSFLDETALYEDFISEYIDVHNPYVTFIEGIKAIANEDKISAYTVGDKVFTVGQGVIWRDDSPESVGEVRATVTEVYSDHALAVSSGNDNPALDDMKLWIDGDTAGSYELADNTPLVVPLSKNARANYEIKSLSIHKERPKNRSDRQTQAEPTPVREREPMFSTAGQTATMPRRHKVR